MANAPIKMGGKVRPEGSLSCGTIGCLAEQDGAVHLVTCDHVIKTPATPEAGPWSLYAEFDGTHQKPIAEYRGLSLADSEMVIADLAAAAVLETIHPGPNLPVRDLAPVRVGDEVDIWGAATLQPIHGTIVKEASDAILPHPLYGDLPFQFQFAIRVDPRRLPRQGDSGGPVIRDGKHLVGFLMAGPSYCKRTGSECMAFGVPAGEALEALGLHLLPGEWEAPS
jgi:hypothetical protein